MKKQALIIMVFVLASCSKECDYSPDHERIAEITKEVDEVKEKMQFSTGVLRDVYALQLEKLQTEMDEAVGGCEE